MGRYDGGLAVLSGHLERLADPGHDHGVIIPRHFVDDQAQEILKNPQAHIDVLVAAGVLEDRGPGYFTAGMPRKLYSVVQPHEHEWRVHGIGVPLDDNEYPTVGIGCDCGEKRQLPNRLPLEVPE